MPQFVKGSDVELTVTLQDKATKAPYSLAGLTGCTGYFPDSNDSFFPVTGVLVSADLGKVKFDLSDSADLKDGDISFQVDIDQSAKRTVVVFDQALTVIAQLF